ncbi:hypothetical protein [Fluviicola sp.]|uniref:hypothetical protein n=1 Tax=Fluviicola sp. TaxID=1917219 RepID=UPI0031DD37D5
MKNIFGRNSRLQNKEFVINYANEKFYAILREKIFDGVRMKFLIDEIYRNYQERDFGMEKSKIPGKILGGVCGSNRAGLI